MINERFSYEVTQDAVLESNVIFLRFENPQDPAKNIQAGIAPELGSNLWQFRVGEKSIIYTDKERLRQRLWTGCFNLWPYPNRIRGKEYEFEGIKISLKDIKRKEGNEPLIHGLIDDQVWQYENPVIEDDHVSVATRISITLYTPLYRFFPWESRLQLKYILGENGLKVEYEVVNNSDKRMPFGFALHPYFPVGDETLIRVGAKYVMEADEEFLPSGKLISVTNTPFDLGEPRRLRELDLDHVFLDLDPKEPTYIEYPGDKIRVYLTSSPDLTHVVVYTRAPGKPFCCIENQSGSTDMINLHSRAVKENDEVLKRAAHLLILEPGNRHQGFINYLVERIEDYKSMEKFQIR